MKYPKFLSKGSTIGITAISAGVGNWLEAFKSSIWNIEKSGFKTVETDSVRVNHYVSNTGSVRAKELDEIILNDDVDMIMCAAGGDFALEMLSFVNADSIIKNPKWIMGASDSTSLLYYVTTVLDIATMYGYNAGSFDVKKLHEANKVCLEYIKGNLVKQHSYALYESDKGSRTMDGYILDTPVVYENINGEMDVTGRLIGGCIDVLKDIIGTKYDGTKQFLEKYKEDGIVWYFDNYALSSDNFYRTLIQMREAGWFEYTRGIVVGRVMYPTINFEELTYQETLKKTFRNTNIPIVFNADIGHVVPKMTLINGAIVHIVAKDGKGSIEFELK